MGKNAICRLISKKWNLPPSYHPVIENCICYIEYRLRAAKRFAGEVDTLISDGSGSGNLEIPAHMFLRECWDVLNGTGRLLNCAFYSRYDEAGLYDPLHMTRQCTFYNVRRAVEATETASEHPAAAFMIKKTLQTPDREYEMLSFFYNISLFAPLPFTEAGEFPGYKDIPHNLRREVKKQTVERVYAPKAMEDIIKWLRKFTDTICTDLCRLDQSAYSFFQVSNDTICANQLLFPTFSGKSCSPP